MAEKLSTQVVVGDVILLSEDDCSKLPNVSPGKYVVEDVRDLGGRTVKTRMLNRDGTFNLDNPTAKFHQCPGYRDSVQAIRVVGHMQRIFV